MGPRWPRRPTGVEPVGRSGCQPWRPGTQNPVAGAATCQHGVEDDVAGEFEKVGVALDEDGFVAPLEDVADAAVLAVDVLGVNTVQLAHALGEVGFGVSTTRW